MTRRHDHDAVTYPEVGATRGELPDGYRHIEREALLGRGDELFARASAAVLSWGVQTGSGIRVRGAEPGADAARPLGVGDTVVLRIPPWPRDVPCRVVYLVDEPTRRGFAYGTLPGHPETGEEAFVVERRGDAVVLRIRAFSRASGWFFRLGTPVLLLLQELYTRRYLRALRAPVTR